VSSNNKLSKINEFPVIIDFVVDQDFFDSLSEPGDSEIIKKERFLLFLPLYHLYLLYRIISQLVDKNKMPEAVWTLRHRRHASDTLRILSATCSNVSRFCAVFFPAVISSSSANSFFC